jgi:hypothetical protein
LISGAYLTLTPSSRNMLGCDTVKTSSTSWLPAETWIMSQCPSSCLAKAMPPRCRSPRHSTRCR